ncbi:MAG TPA: STAS domain-containing protein [Candidatus Acidoferrales bacterium]|nr:STAS domain-containing protein [Candidatus Acidoferrales bacterium]
MSFKATSRDVGGVTVIDMDGRITLGEGSALLRDLVREKLAEGHKNILMNLAGINYIDSTGLGELVSGYRMIKSQGGELKLLNLNKKISDLLQITKLYTVFDIHNQEAQAVASFHS